MKWLALAISFSFFCMDLSAQSDYYTRQARLHQSDTAYYAKQAQGYDMDAEYYMMRETVAHLRDAEYYQRQKSYEQTWSLLRKARNATERADANKHKVANARSNAKSCM